MGRLLALALVFTGLAAPARASSAAPWVGVFHLSVGGGSVEDTWNLHHADAGPCDVSQTGSGTETGSLAPGAPVLVTMTGVGVTAFLTPVAGIPATANLDRQGSIEYGPDDGDDGEGCPHGSGEAAPAPDCGTSILPLTFAIVPGATPGLLAQTDALGSRYDNCPVMGEVLPAIPQTLTAPIFVTGVGPAPASPLGLATLQGTDTDSDGDSDITSKLQVDLRFNRVAIVEALDLKDSYKEAPVDRNGDVRLPVTCPPGKPCSGSIAIGTSDTGSETDRAVTAPQWPRPLTQAEPALGTARFKLKAGKRARVRLRLGHGSTQVVSAFAGQQVDVIVRQSAGKKRKPIGFVVGQVRLKVK